MDWQDRADEGESYGAAERYQYFMRPEPREDLGPIEKIDDPYFGPNTEVREMSVGMVRNAKEENKKRVTVFLKPFPHTRIDTAKPLQGWYKGLHEPLGTRPRPCFSEAILTEPYGGFCFPPGTLVDTDQGFRDIQDIKKGEFVLAKDEQGELTWAEVLATSIRFNNEELVIIGVEGEELLLTKEHPVYSLSRESYIPAEELYEGEKIETRLLQDLRDAFETGPVREHSGILFGTSFLRPTNGKTRYRTKGLGTSNLDLLERKLRKTLRESRSEALQGMRSRGSTRPGKKTEGEGFKFERETPSRLGTQEVVYSPNWQKAFRRYEREMRREREARYFRKKTIQEESVSMPERENLQPTFLLGVVSSRPFRSVGTGLGVRTRNLKIEKRRLLLAGFQNRYEGIHRSERVHGPEGLIKDTKGERIGLLDPFVRREEIEGNGASEIVSLKRVLIKTQVYDLQTTTENFFVRGKKGVKTFLVHNCAVGCSFCYINSGFRGYRGTGLITVPLNYGEQIKKQLSKMVVGAPGYFSSFTDPFTPLEAYYHNTENAAREFINVGLPIFFLSRLRYPDWAVEMLTVNKHSYAQKSINTCDADDWQKLSPGAIPLKQNFADITRLKKRGIYISIQVNPIIPGVTSHEQIETLFKQLKNAGADHVIVKFVEAGYSWAPAMVERTIKRFGKERGEAFAALFTENIGGQKTIAEEYRLPAHERYAAAAKKLGLTYATCYEYRKERDESGKVTNSTGISIGREFTTAEQCHGQRVPMYERSNPGEMFKAMDVCPPSGCLYCASENKGEPRCGDSELGQAKAMKLSDYKKPLLNIGG